MLTTLRHASPRKASFAGAFALGIAILLAAPAAAQNTSCRASSAAFSQIREGMSISQVEGIIGCRGEVLSETSMGGIRTVMLAWSGRGSLGANMNAMFQSGRLIMKAQMGLR